MRNHSYSETGLVTLTPSSLGETPGGGLPGGVSTHFFLPRTHAFHADVALGSTCQLEPERVLRAQRLGWGLARWAHLDPDPDGLQAATQRHAL